MKINSNLFLFSMLITNKIHYIILYNECQHNHFIILGNTRLHVSTRLSHPQAYINICVTRYCVHFGIPSCLHSWNTNLRLVKPNASTYAYKNLTL